MTGKFIVLEGPDGAGHGTQAKLLKQALTERGYEVILTREPGGTPLAEVLRDLLRRTDLEDVPSPKVETLMLAAGRSQHLDKLIRPALAEGKVVISERFYQSTIAYQHYGRGLGFDVIRATTNFAIGSFEADVVIVLDVPAEVGLQRKYRDRDSGGEALDRFELEKVEFHERVRSGYLNMVEEYGYTLVDATRSIPEVAEDVLKLTLEVLV